MANAYVSIPKDLTAIKSKFILGMNKRQVICFGAAAVTGLPLFFLLRGFMPTSAAGLIMVIAMLPWFLLAMYEKHGLPLEKFLKHVIAVKFTRPKIRTYQTNNIYAAIERQIQLYREVRKIVSDKTQKPKPRKPDKETAAADRRGDRGRQRRP